MHAISTLARAVALFALLAIATMRATGRDMSSKYKETSTGGLAVNVSVNYVGC